MATLAPPIDDRLSVARSLPRSRELSDDDWPHTTRVLPWLLAAFLAMLYLVPFDSTNLPVTLPVNPALDRFALGFLFLVWLAVSLAGKARPRFKHAPINLAIYCFIAICILSIVVNLHDLTWDGELTLSIKQLSLVASYIAFFYIAASTIRRTEVEPFAKLLVLLAVVTALGTIYEYRTGTDLFFQIAKSAFKGATVGTLPPALVPGGRPAISGPAIHGLADATLLSVAIPFAVVFAVRARNWGESLLWGLAIVILVGGCIATQRKTAFIVPAVSLVALVLYDPRRYLRYWPFLIVIVVAVPLVAPHSISGLSQQLSAAGSSSSTATRTSDYSAVVPYIADHLIIGRGYGSFDPNKYRILDNQMLGFLIQIGVLGTLAYSSIMFAAAYTVHRVARRGRDMGAALMQSVVAVSAGFFVSNFLYDTFGFRQAPYVFFFVAALGAAYAGRTSEEERLGLEPAGEPWREAPWYGMTERFRVPSGAQATIEMPRVGPELSIMIVTYRNPDLTRDCLNSVLAHTRGMSWELLVLDNASDDGTAEMIRSEFPQIDFQASAQNLGFARGNNLLAERATGEFLLLLNPDTVVHPGSINAMLEFAKAHPEGGLYGGRTVTPSGELDPRSCWGAPSLWSLLCFASGLSTAFSESRLFNPESLGNWQRDTVKEVGVVTGCLAMIRADVWRQVEGFDESFWMYGEDADLSLRMAEKGYRPLITPEATITHVVGASSSAPHKAPLVMRGKVAVIRKHWTPGRAKLGIRLLVAGCGLRALLAHDAKGWRQAWRQRKEWAYASDAVDHVA